MLAIFGFIVCFHYSAPWYVWLIGFLCLVLDGGKRK